MSKILLLSLSILFFSCKSGIKDGVIIEKYIIAPHSEDYRYATTIIIGKVPMTQWHTGTRYIPYYTYCITIQKIVDSDTFTRNLSISKSSYEYYKVGDKIQVLE